MMFKNMLGKKDQSLSLMNHSDTSTFSTQPESHNFICLESLDAIIYTKISRIIVRIGEADY